MFGDLREMVLHYFLADDTIEFREIIRANAGRDAVPMFLRRQKLPKVGIVGIAIPLTIFHYLMVTDIMKA
jgi:hypothetical protein